MFSSLGWPELAVLILVALVIFGPDRLPGAVKQAGTALRSARELLTGARKQMTDEFGDVMPDFDPAMLNPKAFVRKHLLEDINLDDEPVKPAVNAMQDATPPAATPPATNGVTAQSTTNGVSMPPATNGTVNGTIRPGFAAVPVPTITPIAAGKSPVVISSTGTPVPPPAAAVPVTPYDEETT